MVKYSGVKESLPYFVICLFGFLNHFSLQNRKKLAMKIFFSSRKSIFRKCVSSQENLTLCKTYYFVSKKVLATMISVYYTFGIIMLRIVRTFIEINNTNLFLRLGAVNPDFVDPNFTSQCPIIMVFMEYIVRFYDLYCPFSQN